jgi:hypothetical protein
MAFCPAAPISSTEQNTRSIRERVSIIHNYFTLLMYLQWLFIPNNFIFRGSEVRSKPKPKFLWKQFYSRNLFL